MTSRRWRPPLLLLAALAALARSQGGGYDFSPLDAWLSATSTANAGTAYESVGLVVGGLSGVLYSSATGNFSLNTVIPIGTATQWVSASIIAMALGDVAGSLNEPISKYFGPGVLPGSLSATTFRQLLSHTSGIGASLPCAEAPLTTLIGTSANTTYAGCIMAVLSDASWGLPNPPGSKYVFSGGGMQLAAAAVMAARARTLNSSYE